MKVKDIPELKQRILDTLPVRQSDLWKMLKIDHRDASEIVGIMVKENLIKKTKIDHTFILESPNGDEKKKEKDFSSLISGSGKFSPCSGCPDECFPADCKKLSEWVLDNKKDKKLEDKEKVEDKVEVIKKEKEKKLEDKEKVEVIKKEKDKNKKLEEKNKLEEKVEVIKKEKEKNKKLEEKNKLEEKVEEEKGDGEKEKKKKKFKIGKSEKSKNLVKSERTERIVLQENIL